MTRFDESLENVDGIIPPKPKWHFVKPWDRHGLILVTAGVSYILVGIAFLLSEETETRRKNLQYAIDIMPYKCWCMVFIVVGVIAIISSRWPSTPRTLGYSILTGWTAAQAAVYILGGLSDPLNLSYVATGFVWCLVGFLWWAIGGLICPPTERGSRGRNASPRCHYNRSLDSGIVSNSHTTGGSESEPKHSN